MARILIVDDEPDIRTIARHALTPVGHEVATARSAAEALTILAEEPPDAVVLDIMMPGMDGFELLAKVRQQRIAPDARFVLMTCRTSERDHLRGFELGADDYLTKPFDIDQLVGSVARVLDASPAELAARRADELAKAALLDRLEAAMRRPGRSPVA